MDYKNTSKGVEYDEKLFANKDDLVFSKLSNLDYYSPVSVHWNKYFELILVVEGAVDIIVLQKRSHLKEGDLAILNHDEIHVLEKTEDKCVLLILQISPDLFSEGQAEFLEKKIIENIILKKDKKSKLITAFIYIISRMHFEPDTKQSRHYKQTALIIFLFEYLFRNLQTQPTTYNERQSYDSRIHRIDFIYEYVNTNYDKKIFLADLSCKLGLTLSYLSHFIKENFSLNFRDYLSEIRFKRAVCYFVNTEKSVNQVALECGFSDARYLSSLFKLYFNTTPENFKLSYTGKPDFIPNPEKCELRGYLSSLPSEKYYDIFNKVYRNQLEILLDFFNTEF